MGGTATRRTWRLVRTTVMTTFAAIDVGTNSTNLLVIDEHGTELTRTITSTRLGEGLQSTGELSLEAITRTVEVIASYVTTAQALGVTNIQIVGTAACRRARNAHCANCRTDDGVVTGDVFKFVRHRTNEVGEVFGARQV